ncbi:DMT family transporter [uncultured Lutibacter sp.]|uniref:DMT family transporter n=1 Tax=uncultured Lutibacter sp. TaxID=437739 RepID=UPI0026287FE0|nr:DMT family transporter [uncultured Lutibacter sp.]
MKTSHIKHLTELNFAMMLISTSGVLGRYISMPPPITIWWRSAFAVLCLAIFIWYKKINLKIGSKRDLRTIIISGFLMGTHWITYFYALKLSGVAIGMLAMFTYPIITVFLEPLFFKTRLNLNHVFLGILVLVGIYFLTPEFDLGNNVTLGILSGIISAVFYAIRNILMKKKTASYHGSMLMFYQMIIITIVLWPVFFVFEGNPSTNDWLGLGALALLTTAVGHTLFVLSMKNFSIGTISIMSSIQPIYGILFGMLFLSEIPGLKTVIGGVLIIATVVIESFASRK